MIKSQKEMFDFLSAENEESAKRNVYKYTSCGAWIIFSPDGIDIGSIVEGSDEGTQTHSLIYPFSGEEYDACIKEIEDEASAIWDWANEPLADGETAAELGIDMPWFNL